MISLNTTIPSANRCPVDLYVFPELQKAPDGALEAEFYAFKIPDSTFLVFQATVRTCRGPCEPVICNDKGRGHAHFPSFGRKRRRRDAEKVAVGGPEEPKTTEEGDEEEESPEEDTAPANNQSGETSKIDATHLPMGREENETLVPEDTGPIEEVHELLRVYMSRSEVPVDPPEAHVSPLPLLPPRLMSGVNGNTQQEPLSHLPLDKVCVTQSGYYALVTAITVLVAVILGMTAAGTMLIRKTGKSNKSPVYH